MSLVFAVPDVPAFKTAVNEYLAASGVSPWAFGKRVCNNVHFVPRLQNSKDGPKLASVHRALAIINDWRLEQTTS